MAKAKTPSFVLTLKLNTSVRDEKILHDRFFTAFLMQNKLIRHARKRIAGMRQDPAYRTCMKELDLLKGKTDPVSKQKRAALGKELSVIRDRFGLSEYRFHSWIAVQKNKTTGIDIHSAQKLASAVWTSVESVLYRNGRCMHFHKFDRFLSMEGKSNDAGIRFKDGRLYWGQELCIQPQIRKNDHYAREALDHRVKYCRIVRRPMGLSWHYYLQLVLEGTPPEKHRFRKDGIVGIDQGVSTEAVVSERGCILEELSDQCADIQKEVRRIQRKMDRSKRIMNPDCYEKDGTVKKGVRFKYSKTYKRDRMRVKDLYRKASERSRQYEESLANTILCDHGTEIITEPMNYQALARRAKETVISEKTGRFRSKKRFGASVSAHSPSRFRRIMERKLGYIGKKIRYVDIFKYRASQYDHKTGRYEKHGLSARSKTIGSIRVQRDLYSAFLLMCAKDELGPDRELCEKLFPSFLLMHNDRISQMIKSNKKFPSSMGLDDFRICFGI